MQVKHIIFDLDGTLSDPADGIRNSLAYSLEKLKINIAVDEVFDRFVGPPLQHGYSEIIGLDETNTEIGVKYFREYYASKGVYESIPYDGILALLSELREKDSTLYVATSKYEKYALELLRHHKMDMYFKRISGADYKGTAATKKTLIGKVLENIPVDERASAVMIGDRKFDIDGAKENNIRSIGVLYGFGDRQELREADHIVESIGELRRLLLNT